jgi:hypothetical protein
MWRLDKTLTKLYAEARDKGPERTISGSKFSNIASIYVKIETRGLVSSQWKKYIKYSVYHVTDLANVISVIIGGLCNVKF